MKKIKATGQYQQGDILLERISALPPGIRKDAGLVLAQGEATGHAHRLVDSSDSRLVEIDGALYLVIGAAGATIAHEEHGPIHLESGQYRVGRVREYDYFAEEAREIRD